MVCEPFTQWALEDRFTTGRPPYDDAGVQLVPDVTPYELMKLRLLNASHQALCYLGYLAGYRYAHEVCQDKLFVDFLLGYMDNEGEPTLPAVPVLNVSGLARVVNPLGLDRMPPERMIGPDPTELSPLTASAPLATVVPPVGREILGHQHNLGHAEAVDLGEDGLDRP